MYKLIDWEFYKTEKVDMQDIPSVLNNTSEYISSKIKLELENEDIWKPANPKIKLNPKNSVTDKPQAWEKDWKWYYNYEWAIQEAEYLWKKIPTKDKWEELIDSWVKLPFSGYRVTSTGQFSSQGTYGYYWSSSPYSSYLPYAYFANFYVWGGIIANNTNRAYGFSLRCLKN